MRERYKPGCVWRRGDVWYFRAGRKDKAHRIGTATEYPTVTKARKAARRFVYQANDEQSLPRITLSAVVERYRKEEMPPRKCTSRAYENWLRNHIEPRLGEVPVNTLDAYEVKLWLDTLQLSGKSKSEIKGLIKRLLRCAMLWGMIPKGPNEMDLFRLKGVKRRKQARILTVEEFKALIEVLNEPFKTMALVAQFHGLGASEVLGLRWKDVDWFKAELQIQRSVVLQVEDSTKTPNREARLPLTGDEVEMLQRWRQKSEFVNGEDYIFASPHLGGSMPYHYTSFLWKLEGATKRAGIPRITTHTFRHTYRSWAGVSGIPVALIKDLMRHADIRTTMNVYGSPVASAMRDAHNRIVEMVAKQA